MYYRKIHCKIHRATVTEADVDYEGSITISGDLMDAAGLDEFEAVQVWNVTNGQRFETYSMRGESNSGVICVNGAAAHLVSPGDLVIIACFRNYAADELKDYHPAFIFVDKHNRIREIRDEVPGPEMVGRSATQ